jgi:hypothetical protein
MTVLYVETNTGFTGLIAASEDERKLEEKCMNGVRNGT